jgi:hypothetical protein
MYVLMRVFRFTRTVSDPATMPRYTLPPSWRTRALSVNDHVPSDRNSVRAPPVCALSVCVSVYDDREASTSEPRTVVAVAPRTGSGAPSTVMSV